MANDNPIEKSILETLNEKDVIEDTGSFAEALGKEHGEVVGSMKSLQASEMISVEVHNSKWICFQTMD